ncbi:hypothetical protein MT418_006405 [Batrachochytrium dendrobatidis]
MLHELLAGLLGYGSALSLDHLPGLHPSEKQIIVQLQTLGSKYVLITNFVHTIQKGIDCCLKPTTTDKQTFNITESSQNGLYLNALAMGIQTVLVEPYRTTVVDLERHILDPNNSITRGGATPVSMIAAIMEPFQLRLDHVLQTIKKASDSTLPDDQRYTGIHILDLLRDQSVCGIPSVKDLMHRLHAVCMRVFCKQLMCWMMYGLISDPYQEFFIVAKNQKRGGNASTHVLDLQELKSMTWTGLFEISKEKLPYYISIDLAETILFNGKAMSIISSCRPESVNEIIQQYTNKIANVCQENICNIPNQIHDIVTICKDMNKQVTRIIWDIVVLEKHLPTHLNAFRDVFLAGKGDFILELLSEFDRLKHSMNTTLVNITSQDVKQMFHKSWTRCEWPTNMTEHIKSRFSLVLSSLQSSTPPSASTPQIGTYSSTPPDTPVETCHYASHSLGVPLRLDYDISWPLDILLNKSDVDKYSNVFMFLMALRRIHVRLQRVFRERGVNVLPYRQSVWTVRCRMLFFIDCLWSYIQMDLIEVEFQQFVNYTLGKNTTANHADDVSAHSLSLASPNHLEHTSPTTSISDDMPSFDDIQRAHMRCLERICSGCFLDNGSIVGLAIREAIDLCDGLCGLTERIDPHGNGRSEHVLNGDMSAYQANMAAEIESIGQQFETRASTLFQAVSSVQGMHAAKSLGQLLIRLDFNTADCTFSQGGMMAR